MMQSPTPKEIRQARAAANHTQKKAAQVVHRAAAQRWGEWETGTHRMDPAVFELYLLKTGQKHIANVSLTGR